MARYVSEKPTDLLNFLASMPPEEVRPGGQIDVMKPDGTVLTVTLGNAEPMPEPPFQISFRQGAKSWNSTGA